jgi:hypothetical protein
MTAEIFVLEVLVHLNGVLSAPLVLCGYDVPYTPGLIKEADPTALPDGWNAIPHGQVRPALGGGAPGSQPAAQPLASGYATGGAGATGAFSARSTAGLTHFPYSTTGPHTPLRAIPMWSPTRPISGGRGNWQPSSPMLGWKNRSGIGAGWTPSRRCVQEAGPGRGSARHLDCRHRPGARGPTCHAQHAPLQRHHHQPDQSVRADGVTDRAPLSYPLSYPATTGISFASLRLAGWFVSHQKAAEGQD